MTTSNSIMRGVLAVVVFGMLLFTLSTAEAGGQLGTSGQHYNSKHTSHNRITHFIPPLLWEKRNLLVH